MCTQRGLTPELRHAELVIPQCGTNLGRITQRQCVRIAEQLNNHPRLRLGFQTPNEAYY